MQHVKEALTKYLRTFTSIETYPKLGRWNIQYDTPTIHFKIDQANNDHSCCMLHDFTKKENNYLSYYVN